MPSNIKRKWNDLASKLSQTADYWYLTPTNLSMYQILNTGLKNHTFKTVLDLGAGGLAFKLLVGDKSERYIALDIELSNPEIDLQSSGTDLPFQDNFFDLIICSAVLEHTPEPVKMLKEIKRTLSPSGLVIITAPHIHYIHGEPSDFWRFTEFGIRELIKQAGFDSSNLDIKAVGYLFSFIISILIPAILGAAIVIRIPLKPMLILTKYISIVSLKLDHAFGPTNLPLGYISFLNT